MEHTMKVIARIHSDFPEKFGIPRQSGLVPALRAKIVFEPEYRNPDALRGIEGFSHLWLIWQFSAAVRDTWSPTVRPPRLGGNERVGVFATRSPFRPNAIGLSCVKLESVQHEDGFGDVLIVSGADLMDGTPIYDIKPYLPYADAHPEASGGFAAEKFGKKLKVVFPEEGALMSGQCVSIIKGAPHMENAKKFVDYMLSETCQNYVGQNLTVRPLRQNVQLNDSLTPWSEITRLETYDGVWVAANKSAITEKYSECLENVA